MYGLVSGSGWMVIVKTDNTAYQALVLVWLWCGKNGQLVKRSLGPKSRVPDPQSWIPNPRSQTPNPQSQILNPRFQIPNPPKIGSYCNCGSLKKNCPKNNLVRKKKIGLKFFLAKKIWVKFLLAGKESLGLIFFGRRKFCEIFLDEKKTIGINQTNWVEFFLTE